MLYWLIALSDRLSVLNVFRYLTFRADETTFVHAAVFDSDANPLEDLPAFQAFTSGIADRCEEPPAPAAGRLVGSDP